ncbi:MAG: V-type ATP synthase subunit F [Candidatus Margulisiibacteriota bacterium]
MYKIKMIAPKYLIAPLSILGIDTFAADSAASARAALEKAAGKKEPALIFITERLADDLGSEIAKINLKANMNVVLIPDNRGSTGLAASQIQNLVKNSIGAEVIIRK